MWFEVTLSFVTVILAAFGYYLYTPLPSDITEPWKLRTLLAAFRFVRIFPYIAEVTGYGDPLTINRKITSWIFQAAAEKIDSGSLEIRDMEVRGVNVRIYKPKSSTEDRLPGLVFIHGGGFTVFDLDTYDNVVRKLSIDANVIIMSIEYRRTPEHCFPIPLEDCVTATVYFINHASDFGVDPSNIGIAGDSAGGNLAAATARKLSYDLSHDVNYPITFQILIYPMTQAFDFQLPSFITETNIMPEILCTELVTSAWAKYWAGNQAPDDTEFLSNNHITPALRKSEVTSYVNESFLPQRYRMSENRQTKSFTGNDTFSKDLESTILNPYFCPLLADDVTKLPPAFILTTEYDVLRDDGILYARRLQDAGVTVKHVNLHNGYHGIFSFTKFQIGKETMKHVVDYISGRTKSTVE